MTLTNTALAPATWQAWRSARASELNTPFGWLSLTNLVWLSETPTRVPGLPGTWWLDGDSIVGSEPDSLSVLDAQIASGAAPVTAQPHLRVLVSDGQSVTGAVTAEGAQIEFLARSGRRGLRVRAPHNRELGPDGLVPAAPYDPAWLKQVTVTWFALPLPVRIGSAQPGLTSETVVTGSITFDHEGGEQQLFVTGPREAAAVTYADSSSATAKWRFLPLNLVSDDRGNQFLDFNFSTNYPSAFSDFGTCPAPTDGNTLSVAVTAGELQPL